MIRISNIESSNEYSQKLIQVNKLFLESIKEYIDAEILVGSLAWGMNNAVNEKSDIDLVVVYTAKNRRKLITSKYLINSFIVEDVEYVLSNGLADYLVAKIQIENVSFSIDLIEKEYFTFMCKYDLVSSKIGIESWKFGKYKQINTYPSRNFRGCEMFVTKHSVKVLSGYRIQLPLFFLIGGKRGEESEYFYGIPTVKLLTSIPIYNSDFFCVHELLDELQNNIIARMKKEKIQSKYNDLDYNLLNLFIFENQMDCKIRNMFNIK